MILESILFTVGLWVFAIAYIVVMLLIADYVTNGGLTGVRKKEES